MAVMRVHKTKDYTVMSNTHLNDKRMTLKAKGLLSLMLSLPECWDYSIAGLVAICKENETAINSTLKELKQFGYLRVTKYFPNETDNGKIKYVYDIYEQPLEIQVIEKQGIENLPLEKQCIENQGQLNIKQSNTKKESINKKNTNKFIIPTLQEVQDYCKERNNGIDAERFIDFYTAKGWMIGKNKMKDWKSAIRNWERNQPKKQETFETFEADEFFEAALKRTYGDDWKGNKNDV